VERKIRDDGVLSARWDDVRVVDVVQSGRLNGGYRDDHGGGGGMDARTN
jgi:hypothetical protein